MDQASFSRVLLQKKKECHQAQALIEEHHVTAGLARVVTVLDSSNALEFEPKDWLLIRCKNLDRTGSESVKTEIMYLPY